MKTFRIYIFCVSFVFLSIALPTYLCGCDNIIQPNCMKYNMKTVKIINNLVKLRECSICSIYGKKCHETCTGSGKPGSCTTSCTTYCSFRKYYDCYDSYAVAMFDYDNKNKTCMLSVDSGNINENQALIDSIIKYPKNSTHVMYIDKINLSCNTKQEVKNLAIVGFTFLLLLGITIIIWLIIEIHNYQKTIKKNSDTLSIMY